MGFFNHQCFCSGMQLFAHTEFLVGRISPLGETNFSSTNVNAQNWALWSVVTTGAIFVLKENAPNGIYQSKTAASFYFGCPPKKGRIKRGKGEMNPVKVFRHLVSAFLVLPIYNTNFNLNGTFWCALEMLLQWKMGWRVKEHSLKHLLKKAELQYYRIPHPDPSMEISGRKVVNKFVHHQTTSSLSRAWQREQFSNQSHGDAGEVKSAKFVPACFGQSLPEMLLVFSCAFLWGSQIQLLNS